MYYKTSIKGILDICAKVQNKAKILKMDRL